MCQSLLPPPCPLLSRTHILTLIGGREGEGEGEAEGGGGGGDKEGGGGVEEGEQGE